MDDNTQIQVVQGKSPLSKIDVAGYMAVADPFQAPGFTSKRDIEDYDRISLTKLHNTGFDVSCLDEAHDRYKISPIRVPNDLWRILGYHINPQGRSNTNGRYNEDHVSALAFQYPDPQTPGDVYKYERLIRVRPRISIRVRNKTDWETRKYEQPRSGEETSVSEPYFLCRDDMWKRLYDTSQPLLITEGELKAAALGLAGYAAIGFGGVTMWRAPKKAGKDKLHKALDPKTPWAIPIHNRQIILVPDTDYVDNVMVKREFNLLGQSLYNAGASSPKIIFMPQPRSGEWKGIDDYLTVRLGQRWSGSHESTAKAHEIIQKLIDGDFQIIQQFDSYLPTNVNRCRERLVEKLTKHNIYTARLYEKDKNNVIGLNIYDGDRYHLANASFTGGTSGKMTTPNNERLYKVIRDDYTEAALQEFLEDNSAKKKSEPKSMPIDHPNIMMAELHTELEKFGDNTLIEPFSGVEQGDYCLRITNGLVNLTRCFNMKLSWKDRQEWLLPPDHRWFSVGALNVSLSNLEEEPQCPLFMELLRNAFDGDEEKIDCLQQWFGKIITCPLFYKLQQFLCLYGTPGSGKSTIVDILTAILGESEVESIRGDFGGRFDLGGLLGKRLMLFNDTQDGRDNELPQSLTNAIKSITGGDITVIERKRMDPVSTRLKLEILLVSNNPPEMMMDPDAFNRRAVFISTTKSITNPNSDKRDAMFKEMPGIFMWALRGAFILRNTGLRIDTPTACMADKGDATEDVSPEAAFVRNRVAKASNPEALLLRDKLEEAFHDWLTETDRKGYNGKLKRLVRLVRERHRIGIETIRDPNDKNRFTRAFKGLRILEQNANI